MMANLLTNLLKFISELGGLIRCLNELSEALSISITLLNSAMVTANSLGTGGSDLSCRLRRCKETLELTRQKSKTFTERIENFFHFAHLSQAKVCEKKDSFKRSDVKPIKDYIKLLRKYLKQIQESYDKFEEEYVQAEKECLDALTYCEQKGFGAQCSKFVTKFFSNQNVLIGIGAGVAGVVSFGVGSLVWGLVGAVAAAGTVTATGTAETVSRTAGTAARSFEEKERLFKERSKKLDELNDKVPELRIKMKNMLEMLKNLDIDAGNLYYSIRNDVLFGQFSIVFDILQNGIKDKHCYFCGASCSDYAMKECTNNKYIIIIIIILVLLIVFVAIKEIAYYVFTFM